jgi:hypothetical protein
MDAFRELIYPAYLNWSAIFKDRAMRDPSSVTPEQLLDTLTEIWDEDDAKDDESRR